ncbi:hypothetical protein IQE94_16530 [Synechocystis sp. PCC 7339]|uniref:hypothetical protein n=1 Tax=unclassified Synechocystis TaxID=2640012 RepID=UPI0016821251|nr:MULTISPECIES: hypothetical protein [unclassified Synechocystis]MBD2654681.1 hypothetical protein [Synechocystis sp. FACHB-383]QUS59225.1 hypothetical protein HTZ78_04025 [Synechocystis sp. PCC 7338]UAJ74547.1 hypothetical protein IQE94_16530 [Synechocystis sp. PCC 7339]
MNSNFSLKFLAVPAFALSIATMGIFDLPKGSAFEAYSGQNPPSPLASCPLPEEVISLGRSPHGEVLMASAANVPIPAENPSQSQEFDFDFSYAESDAAVALFGCDCPACIGALRQLRSQPYTSQRLTSNRPTADKSFFSKNQARFNDPVEGHCWANLQELATEEDIQVVLQTLENEESVEKAKETF